MIHKSEKSNHYLINNVNEFKNTEDNFSTQANLMHECLRALSSENLLIKKAIESFAVIEKTKDVWLPCYSRSHIAISDFFITLNALLGDKDTNAGFKQRFIAIGWLVKNNSALRAHLEETINGDLKLAERIQTILSQHRCSLSLHQLLLTPVHRLMRYTLFADGWVSFYEKIEELSVTKRAALSIYRKFKRIVTAVNQIERAIAAEQKQKEDQDWASSLLRLFSPEESKVNSFYISTAVHHAFDYSLDGDEDEVRPDPLSFYPVISPIKSAKPEAKDLVWNTSTPGESFSESGEGDAIDDSLFGDSLSLSILDESLLFDDSLSLSILDESLLLDDALDEAVDEQDLSYTKTDIALAQRVDKLTLKFRNKMFAEAIAKIEAIECSINFQIYGQSKFLKILREAQLKHGTDIEFYYLLGLMGLVERFLTAMAHPPFPAKLLDEVHAVLIEAPIFHQESDVYVGLATTSVVLALGTLACFCFCEWMIAAFVAIGFAVAIIALAIVVLSESHPELEHKKYYGTFFKEIEAGCKLMHRYVEHLFSETQMKDDSDYELTQMPDSPLIIL